MKTIKIEKEVLNKFGCIKIAYLLIEGVNIEKTPPREKKIARKIESEIREEFRNKNFEDESNINTWISFSNKMGNFEEEFYPAHIGLVQRILSGRDIPKINNIVDAGNIISAKYKCPVGIFDSDKISDKISLKISDGNELYIPILSENEVKIATGEVIYSDGVGVFSRYSKDADRTKVTDNTKNLLCVIDGTDLISAEYILAARDELLSLIKEVCVSELKIYSNIILANGDNNL